MKQLRRFLLTFGFGVVTTGIVGAFVVESYWNWFIGPPLHAENIGMLQALGMLWLFDLILTRASESAVSEKRWELLFAVIDRALPADRVEAVNEIVREKTAVDGWELFETAATRLGTLTLSWILGYVLHIFV